MMWRSSVKFKRPSRLFARRFSSLKKSSVSGRSIEKVVPKLTKQSALRYLSTNATEGGSGVGGKIVIGATAVAVTVAGGLYYVSNNEDLRKNIEEKVPFTTSIFNSTIGKSRSGTNLKPPAIPQSSQLSPADQIFARQDVTNFKPSEQEPVLKRESPPGKTVEEELFPREVVQPDKKSKRKTEPVATVSSVDQMAVSSVDLDISKTVEKEVLQAEGDGLAAVSDTKKRKQIGKKGGSNKEEKAKMEESRKGANAQDENSVVSEETEMPEEALSKTTTALDIALQTALAAASELGEKVIESHEKAIEAVRSHKKSVSEVLQEAENKLVLTDNWEILGSLSQTKAKAVKEAETMAAQLNDVIEKVHMIVAEGKEKGLEATAEVAAKTVAQLTYALQQAKSNLKEIQSEGSVLKQFQDYVKENKEHLKEQLASIRPDLQDSKLEDKTDDALLAYAHDRIRVLEEALEQREVEERKVIEQALDKQQKEHEKLAEMRLKHELETLKNELNKQIKQKEATLAEEHENDIRQQLRRQATVFGDHMNDVLKVQASELGEKYQSEKREELLLQRQEFELKLRGTLARLEGVMTSLQNRADIEKANGQAQELWLACQSLSTAITGLGDDRPRLYPIKGEVEKIRRITNGNEVVDTILDSLPNEVLHRGVFPEESLRRRFPFVCKVCKQVALVGEEGGGVWSYLLSYLQSLLVFDVRSVKKPESVDPEELDTHTILSLATSSLNEGDTEQAVRYMNQLRGEPRRVARDWIQEARLFLETRQVARFLTSFASAYNIGAAQE